MAKNIESGQSEEEEKTYEEKVKEIMERNTDKELHEHMLSEKNREDIDKMSLHEKLSRFYNQKKAEEEKAEEAEAQIKKEREKLDKIYLEKHDK